ncbi:Ig-like domain-containing protein [Hyalangium gracile]|uniref:Ig-like domain-containing protein n=1 Tax=Hyalangium gracile TaxID=394092 RepID=UPI001CCCD5F8|nr:Ig-like domain-containing protein [Hyalangium gracile]
MNRLFLLFVGCFLLVGCSVNFTEPPGRRCDDSHACPPEQVCIELRCQSAEELPPDGGSPADGGFDGGADGGMDGGTDGGTDGGMDGGTDAGISVSVNPTSVSIAPNTTYAFTATVSNASNPAVTWSVSEGAAGGSIEASGLYTAPATTGTYHVVATSVADPSRSATATVYVAILPPNIALHLSADRLLGEGVALPADGAPVSSWVDLSGNGRDVGQSEATRQPVFKLSGLNGLPTVAFDGNTSGEGDYLLSAAFASPLPQPLTVFLVYKSPQVDANKTLMDAPSAAGTNRIRLQATTVPLGALQLYATKFTSPGTQKMAGAFYQATAVYDGVNSRLRVNMIEEALNNRDTGPVGMGGLLLGGRQDRLDTSFAQTEIAELLVFARLLTDSERDLVELYLRDRYFP